MPALAEYAANTHLYGVFDARSVTDAPLQLRTSVELAATPRQAFERLSNHEHLVEWAPGLKHVEMDHAASSTPEQCGVGSLRICDIEGIGAITEEFMAWDPARRVFAYRLTEGKMPMTDHLSVVTVDSRPGGGSRVVFHIYFRPTGIMGRLMLRLMMGRFMRRVFANLERKLGEAA